MAETKHDVWYLLALAEAVNPPDDHPIGGECEDKVFDASGGWKVVIYYDCGDLDYITHFVTPEGEVLDFWDRPESHERDVLINWRGVGDRARLLEIHQRACAAFVRARVGDWAHVKHEPGLLDDGYEVVEVDDGQPGRRLCVAGRGGSIWGRTGTSSGRCGLGALDQERLQLGRPHPKGVLDFLIAAEDLPECLPRLRGLHMRLRQLPDLFQMHVCTDHPRRLAGHVRDRDHLSVWDVIDEGH